LPAAHGMAEPSPITPRLSAVNPDVVRNVYVNRTIVEQTTIVNPSNVSYNGGPNGIQHQPAPRSRWPCTSSTLRQLRSRCSIEMRPPLTRQLRFEQRRASHQPGYGQAAGRGTSCSAGGLPASAAQAGNRAGESSGAPATIAAATVATTRTRQSPRLRLRLRPGLQVYLQTFTAPMPPTKPAGLPPAGTPLPSRAKTPTSTPVTPAAPPAPKAERAPEPEHAPAAAPKAATPPPPRPHQNPHLRPSRARSPSPNRKKATRAGHPIQSQEPRSAVGFFVPEGWMRP